MSAPQFSRDISKILDNAEEQNIAIDKCHTGSDQARQQGTEVKEDSDESVEKVRLLLGC